MEIEAQGATITDTAEACLLSFNKCLDLFAVLPPQQRSAVEDQLGRFLIIDVFASYRASLDYRLRGVADVQQLVRGLLRTLNEHIQEYLAHLDHLGLTRESADKIEDNRLGVVVDNIAGEINLLHQLSNTIRKASNEKNNLKSATSFVISDEDGNDIGPAFVNLFAMEIIRRRFPDCDEKIKKRLADAMLLRRKRILYRSSRYGKIPTRNAAFSPQKLVPNARKDLDGIQNTSRPVGDMHPGRSCSKTQNHTPSTAGSRAITATTLNMEHWNNVSTPSVVGTTRTIKLGDYERLEFPPAPKGPIIKKLKELEETRLIRDEECLKSLPNYCLYVEHDGQTVLEDALATLRSNISDLEVELQAEIENDQITCCRESMEGACPYCCCVLSGETVMNHHLWVDHVKHDLDPYVCLFETCDKSDVLYKHSEDWLKHMRQHKLRWRCTAKAHGVLVFADRNEYEQHMNTTHKSARSQLSVIAALCSRSAGPVFESCPLCGESDSNGQLEDHVATHLRYLAFKSLQFPEDPPDNQYSDGDVSDSDASSGRRLSTLLVDSEDSSLSFDSTPERINQMYNFSVEIDGPSGDSENGKPADLSCHRGSHSSPSPSVEFENKANISPRRSPIRTYGHDP
ncbi:uncharacterized protein TRUGW13939_08407 [Talaromyces rugulosus]|uniref:C2H2-type domain-containing protein n=1 Tax=Talaromyces rugulosus TaxID=121627 RepID=A0A7H8R4F6_TALRU|nr:uncharacterized protein TRUGW13939_08407 [Talaromyces rugulosus]QKX61259.1 hypothetical protein TRUGW13939_08407 [Talaromyces rugulosus]